MKKHKKEDYIIALNYYLFQLLDGLTKIFTDYKNELKEIIIFLRDKLKNDNKYVINLVDNQLKKKSILLEWLSLHNIDKIIEYYGSNGGNMITRKLIILWSLLEDKNKKIIWKYIDIMLKIIVIVGNWND